MEKYQNKPITFAGSSLDRAAEKRRDAEWVAARLTDPSSRFLALRDLKPMISLRPAPAIAWSSAGDFGDALQRLPVVLLGTEAGRAYFAVDANGHEGAPLPDQNIKHIDVRSIAPQLAPNEAAILAQSRSIIDWHARHRFCAACGGPTLPKECGYSRQCQNPECKAQHFPRTDPVTIMLVIREGRCLLGRQRQFPPGMYSALAGFVEPGESIEEAVRREVLEESGITAGAVRYVASQPWPFPSSLMIGCIAEALDEKITVDMTELEDARWFSRDEVQSMLANSHDMSVMPRMPQPLSLAHQLGLRWLAGA